MGVWNKLTGQIPEPYPSLYEKPLTHDDLARSLLIADVRTESFQQLLDNQMSDIRRYPQQIDEQLDRVVEQSRDHLESVKLETAAMVAGYELERTTKQPEIEPQLERSIEERPIVDERQQDARQEDLNPILNHDRELTRQEKLELSHEKIDDIREIYVNRIHEANQKLSDINAARQVDGYWEQSQEIIQADTDRADFLLSQRLNLYEILDRTPDEQQAYLDQHPEFDLVLNKRDYDKVQVALDDLSENMPKPITLENNPDDYKVDVWDSVTESINDTLQQSDDAIREALKLNEDDGLALATLKRTSATAIGVIAGAGDFVTDTGEGLYHLADSSANYLWGNAVGAVDYLSGHTLSDNFEYVRNVNIQTNQTHDQIVDVAKATYDMGVLGIAESGVNYVGNSLSAIGEGWETGDIDKIRSGTKGVINTATFVVPAGMMVKAGYVEGVSQLSKLSEYRQINNMFTASLTEQSIKLTLENPALKVELPSNYYIDRALERLMLTKEEFVTLKNMPTESLTQQQISQLKLVREAVPTLTVESPLQKVFPVGDIDKYLSGKYVSPSGFIAREADLMGVKHYDDMVEALRLDYLDGQGARSAFPEGGNSYGMIRYKSTDAYNAEIPFNKEFGGTFDNPPPFGGAGFTTSRDGRIIPEFSIPRQQRDIPPILDGAELIKVENGVEKTVGRYNKAVKRFIPEE